MARQFQDQMNTGKCMATWAFHRTNVEFGKTLVAERIGLKATVELRVT